MSAPAPESRSPASAPPGASATARDPSSPAAPDPAYPTLDEIRAAAARLEGRVLHTPVWRWRTGSAEGPDAPAEVWLKLELWQRTGSFKLRGALNCIASLDEATLARGVVASSAGNHAIAVAAAARAAGSSAIVAMPRHASSARIDACRAQGAQVLLCETIHEAFETATRVAGEQGRTLVHPFEGPLTAQGTATVGLELMQQVEALDAVIVPVGGGGLCAGVAAAVRQLSPPCEVYGVEPFGADAMYRSFQAGAPASIDHVDSIADSLGAPYALPYSFGVCRRFVREIVRVTDDELVRAMLVLHREMKLVAEPAAAAATAAMLGPLRARLRGRRAALIVSGSNLDARSHARLLERALALEERARR